MYLQRIEITNFACLRDVKMDFTPLHALIGPNDSGKSTILRAVRTLTQFLAMSTQPRTDQVMADGRGLDPTVGSQLRGQFGHLSFGVQTTRATGAFSASAKYGLSASEEFPALAGESAFWGILANSQLFEGINQNPELRDRVTRSASLVRFDPDALRAATRTLLDTEGIQFADERGKGLAAVYDAIISRDRDAIATIEQRVRELFPTVKRIELSVPIENMKAVKVTLKDGSGVGSNEMSEGLLHFLGFAALQYCGASLLLVEEPENGLHPSRIRDVMNILKEISRTTQVLIATHSPLVVNEIEGDQVTVVTREIERGTQVRRLSTTTDFEVRSKAYLPGELWLNYANGVDEADLLAPRKPEP